MTKIRGSTLLQIASGAVPMNQMGASGFYLRRNVPWGKKPVVIANMPHRNKNKEPDQYRALQRRYYHTLEELERMRKMKEKRR